MILSCTVKKNEFKKPRFNESRFSLKMIQGEENKVKRMICLDCIYRLDKIVEMTTNQELINFKQIYLKFYENGRVAVFNEETIAEMNPKKADMGIYQYKNNKLYYEYFSYSPQAGYYKSKQELLIENNILIEKNSYYTGYYEKLNLTTKSYIRPDW
jgi:hypothetical protein